MLNQSLNSEFIVAKVQSRIAKFLAMREKILRVKDHPDPAIRAKAASLLVAQGSLEGDIAMAQDKINKVQSGAYTYSDILYLGDVAYRMETHIKRATDLEREAGGEAQPKSGIGGYDWFTIAKWGAIALLIKRVLRL